VRGGIFVGIFVAALLLAMGAQAASFGGNCVAYARQASGISLDGNAGSWWSQADGRYERGKFETVTGDIVYGGDVGFKGSVDLTTHSGRVELRLPPKPNVELDAATGTGTIGNAVTSSRPIAGREGRGMELGFSSGTGDTRVVIRSFKGNVELKPR